MSTSDDHIALAAEFINLAAILPATWIQTQRYKRCADAIVSLVAAMDAIGQSYADVKAVASQLEHRNARLEAEVERLKRMLAVALNNKQP